MQETKFTPPVIEPSFGIGRVLYSFLEHSFDIRNKDKQRAYLKFKQWIAPTKVALLPLSKNAAFDFLVQKARGDFMKNSVSARNDESGDDQDASETPRGMTDNRTAILGIVTEIIIIYSTVIH